jgi:hypothetical protein
MPRVRIAPALPDRTALDVEIARPRNLDIVALRSLWHSVLGRQPPLIYPVICCFGPLKDSCPTRGNKSLVPSLAE